MDSDTKDKVNDLKNQKWMRAEMSFEVLGVNKEIAEKSLKEHMEKMSQLKTMFIFRKDFSKVEEIENPLPKVKKAYSQVVEVEAMVRDIKSLLAIAISFGPSSIEIMEPDKIEVSSGEMQDVANMVSGIIHQIAAAGLGGIVATPKSCN